MLKMTEFVSHRRPTTILSVSDKAFAYDLPGVPTRLEPFVAESRK